MYCLITSLCHTVNPFLHHFDSFCVAFFLISSCFLLFVSSHACTGRLAHSLVILILSAPLHSHVCTYVCVCVFECACVFCISICSLSAVHLCSKYESVRLSGCLHVCVCVCVISLWSKGMAQLPVQLIRLSESLCPYFAKTNTQKCRDTGREKHPGHFTHSCAKQNTSDPRYKTSKTSDYWHRHTLPFV